MSKSSWVMAAIGIAAALGLLIFYALGYTAYTSGSVASPPVVDESPDGSNPSTPPTGERITVNGVWECLPHKNTSGPQTLECAFGVAKDQSDGHYAIDTRLMATYPVDYPTGAHVRVEGMLVPRNAENSSAFDRYDIDGIIAATTITQL